MGVKHSTYIFIFNDNNIVSKIDLLKTYGAEVCVSINWLTLLNDSLLNSFKFGILNAHAGDLPRYKGNACPNWAILNFEKKIGLTIHKMTKELDSGPYLKKYFLDIDEFTYIGEIYNWLEIEIPNAFLNSINNISDGFINQSGAIKTLRTFPRKPEDSKINWNDSARNITALVRASSKPFTGAFCYLNNISNKLIIYKASVFLADFDWNAIPGQICIKINDSPIVATGDGLIKIEECVFEEEKDVPAKEIILKSLRNRLI